MKKKIKIAVSASGQVVHAHFGHCEYFSIFEVEDTKIIKEEKVIPPAHQPGVFPKFLAEQGANVIITGGMGHRAQELFTQNNIEVILGVNSGKPSEIVQQYLNNDLKTSQNLCNH